MQTQNVTIINKLGLHARAAAKLVSLASQFSSHVQLARADKTVDGKNMMGVMLLAAGKGTEISLSAAGNDEKQAITALTELIHNRFGESE